MDKQLSSRDDIIRARTIDTDVFIYFSMEVTGSKHLILNSQPVGVSY